MPAIFFFPNFVGCIIEGVGSFHVIRTQESKVIVLRFDEKSVTNPRPAWLALHIVFSTSISIHLCMFNRKPCSHSSAGFYRCFYRCRNGQVCRVVLRGRRAALVERSGVYRSHPAACAVQGAAIHHRGPAASVRAPGLQGCVSREHAVCCGAAVRASADLEVPRPEIFFPRFACVFVLKGLVLFHIRSSF